MASEAARFQAYSKSTEDGAYDAVGVVNCNLGMAYALWTGFGIVGTSVLGVFLFQEKLTVPQVLCVALIVVGIVGLRLLAKE